MWFANSISWGFDLVFKVAPKALAGRAGVQPVAAAVRPPHQHLPGRVPGQTGQTPDDLGIVGWGVGEIVGAGMQSAGKPLGQNSFRARHAEP